MSRSIRAHATHTHTHTTCHSIPGEELTGLNVRANFPSWIQYLQIEQMEEEEEDSGWEAMAVFSVIPLSLTFTQSEVWTHLETGSQDDCQGLLPFHIHSHLSLSFFLFGKVETGQGERKWDNEEVGNSLLLETWQKVTGRGKRYNQSEKASIKSDFNFNTFYIYLSHPNNICSLNIIKTPRVGVSLCS